MSADAASVRFFVDENLLGVGKALERARRDVIYTGHRLIPEVPPGAADTVWIPAVAARDLVVIMRDRHVRTRRAELEELRKHGLRIFYLAGKRDLTVWGQLVLLVRRWQDIEAAVARRGAGPWFIAINETNLREIKL